jgi:diguanylate cyclase (GGDEF)-like protein
MGLKTESTSFFAGLSVMVVVVLVGVGLISFRYFSLSAAEEQARTAAEIVRVHLTESMVNATISKRKTFLDRLSGVKGLLDTRVIRGPGVARQFGPGLDREQKQDAIEARVLVSGEPFFGLVTRDSEEVFRATIPYIAQDRNEPHCLQCHQVKLGEVLGVISLFISISGQRDQAIMTVVFMTIVVMLFAVTALYFLRNAIKPLIDTAESFQEAVADARRGDFSTRIAYDGKSEVGKIARDLNVLMGLLQDGLGIIARKVAGLIRYEHPIGANQLATTIQMVESLEEVSHFKQAIEEDETKEEVYTRLARVIQDEFMVGRFSIYEVVPSKNRIQVMVVDGQTDEACRWCDPQILLRSDSCRAKRTGHTVDGVTTPGICTSFNPPQEQQATSHICIPMMQSGSVGSVVQLITDQERMSLVVKMLPFIQIYLREAAPVLEAKRLMSTLRDSSLRDPMTGLHNRRFLQEYVESLLSYTSRHKGAFSVLMADLDYFKQVNDSYGHEAGDTTLKILARTLRNCVRSSDLVIRYGGEEFLIVLLDTAPEEALEVAEKIRAAVQDLKIEILGTVLKKTLSIGVAGYPEDSSTFWQVVKYADVALYRAKEAGRNKVLRFTPDMWSENAEY